MTAISAEAGGSGGAEDDIDGGIDTLDNGNLPSGWAMAKLGELGVWYGGGTPSKRNPDFWTDGSIPWLSPKDMGEPILSGTRDLIHKSALAASPVKLLPVGTVAIVVRSGILERKVPITYVPFEVTLNQDMRAVAPHPGIGGRWLASAIAAQERRILTDCRKQGTTVASLEVSRLMDVEIPVPPLAEQQRIVAKLDEQLTHVEAGESSLVLSEGLVESFRKTVFRSAIPEKLPETWADSSVESVGEVDLGRQRHPSWHLGPQMRPYLRVANVFEDRIDVSDVKEMDFSETGDRYSLKDGDVLLNEGQSPHLLGRPAIYRGVPEGAAFQNTLLRFRCGPRVTPEWSLLVFRRHMHSGRFIKESRITTNIAHLSASRLKKIEFPVPPLGEQEEIVRQVRQRLNDANKMALELEALRRHAANLRTALLHAALTGTLVPQNPTDEPASVLLARIRGERDAADDTGPQRQALRPRKRTTRTPLAPRPQHPGDFGQEELPL